VIFSPLPLIALPLIAAVLTALAAPVELAQCAAGGVVSAAAALMAILYH